MPQVLPISDIVTVVVSVSPAPPQARSFSVPLILGTSAVLPLYDRVRTYTALAGGVDADFASNTPEYKMAAAAFSKKIASVKIGRQFTANQAAVLRSGAPVDQTLADYTAITTGGFDITIDGTLYQVSGLNFSGAASVAAVAPIVQTALQALLASTTFTYDATAKRFLLTSPVTGSASTVSFGAPPTHSGSPTDVSALLQLTNVTGAQTTQGINAESVTQAWTASAAWDSGWYGMYICSTTAQDSKDSMAFAQANGYFFMDTIADANAEDGTATSDLAYYAKNQGYDHTAVFFDNVNSDKGLGMGAEAEMLNTDYTQPNSAKTLFGKQMPGYAPVVINATQKAGLDGKNCNYLATFGTYSMFTPGKVANGRFIDEVINLDWFAAQAQNNVFTEIVTATTKIPQTDDGAAREAKAIRQACESAKTAGIFAPGVWTGPDTGEVKNGDFLPNGYYVFAAPVSSQSASDRAARKSPPLSALAILAGAIQNAAVGVTIQR